MWLDFVLASLFKISLDFIQRKSWPRAEVESVQILVHVACVYSGRKKGGIAYCYGFLTWLTMILLMPVWSSSGYSDFHLRKVWALVFKSSAAGPGVWWTDTSFGGRNGSLALPAFSLDSCVKFEDVFLYISVLKGSLDALWTKTLFDFVSLGSAVTKEITLE